MRENQFDQQEFLFMGEWLTGEELLERLSAAQEVVSGLTARLGMANDIAISLNEDVNHKQGIIERLVVDMRDNARDLARCAGATHREKNEAILAVIYRLLSAEYASKRKPYSDDVPF